MERFVAEIFDGGWKNAKEPGAGASQPQPTSRKRPADDGGGDGSDSDAAKRSRTPAARSKDSETKILVGQKTLYSALEKDDDWRKDFIVYNRDRCKGVPLPSLGVVQLSSYQLIMEWWAERLTGGYKGARSGLLYHVTEAARRPVSGRSWEPSTGTGPS